MEKLELIIRKVYARELHPQQAQQQVLDLFAVSVAVCPKCKTKDTQVICCTCGHGDNIDDFRQTER